MPDDAAPLEDDPETLRAQNATLQKQIDGLALDNAMLAAGVDLDSKTGQMFRKAWDGEPDVEKIKTEAAEITGALKAAPAPPEGEPAPAAGDAGEGDTQFAERSALATGDPAGLADPHPGDEVYAELDKALMNGARLEDAGGLAIADLAQRAAAGDTRVMVQR